MSADEMVRVVVGALRGSLLTEGEQVEVLERARDLILRELHAELRARLQEADA